ncbi:hypothetical protein B2J88_50935 [Rhodococcus sp. SRB_17]|nr:hypothetical protein [Rhodococcus sp. SRB_17]
MRGAVTIVGAGQAGLTLGIGLLQYGYAVTIVSDRSPDQIRNGRVTSSQCMFDMANGIERSLGLNLWDEECPEIAGMSVSAFAPTDPPTLFNQWSARFERPARSVDQRVKMSTWMEEFERRGGHLVIDTATVASLEQYCQESDLVIVAAGKGEIARLFERNAPLSPFTSPQRSLAMLYVSGLERPDDEALVEFNVVPGVGEYLTYPALAESGPCDIMLFEAIPGGPMDIWDGVADGTELLTRAQASLAKYFPSEAARARAVSLIDENATLVGRLTPTVRRPVAALPSGGVVLGMADVTVINDPITAQGANNATKCADIYLRAITRHIGTFDEEFMQTTFDEFWSYAGPATDFTTQFLSPTPDHARQLHVAAAEFPEIGRRFAECMNDPRDAADWILDPVGAYRYIDAVSRARQPKSA